MTALPLLEQDLQGPEFNDIQLRSSDGELIPCSRFVLCKHSPVFAHLLADTNKIVFSVPLATSILREIRHVCHFGTTSFHEEPINESMMRTLCKLLVALDHYKVDDSLWRNQVYNEIRGAMRGCHSLVCVILDEFGLDYRSETRYWIMLSATKALLLLSFSAHEALLPVKSGFGGVCSIRDANKLQHILSKLEYIPYVTVWFEFEVLYVWAKAKDSNQVAAGKLWKKTDMLKRLQADDPAFFALTCYNVDSFASNNAFAALYKYAQLKNIVTRKYYALVRCRFIVFFSILVVLTILCSSFGWIDLSVWGLARFVAFYSVGFFLTQPCISDPIAFELSCSWASS